MRHGLIDKFNLLTPVAVGRGKHLFAATDWSPHLEPVNAHGVIVLGYVPK
jgi:hypothetical protein